jgi:hypothetical protein
MSRAVQRDFASIRLQWSAAELQQDESDQPIRVPLSRLGEVDNFQGDKLGHLVAFAKVKLGAGSVERRKHNLDVFRIESYVA